MTELPVQPEAVEPLKPRYHGNSVPVFACWRMPTRHCPAVYEDICGDRPCARFESQDTEPWVPEIRHYINRAI